MIEQDDQILELSMRLAEGLGVGPPPLPVAAVNLDKDAWDEMQDTGRCLAAFICGYECAGDKHLYTAEQMREYAREASKRMRAALAFKGHR